MPSKAQIDLFAKLAGEKDFGPKVKPGEIVEQFAELDDRSASAWIERAIELPRGSGQSGKTVTPPFG